MLSKQPKKGGLEHIFCDWGVKTGANRMSTADILAAGYLEHQAADAEIRDADTSQITLYRRSHYGAVIRTEVPRQGLGAEPGTVRL